jgi:hypothetical protein
MTEQIIVTESEQALIKVRDEVLRKVGRNLVNFQKIEQLLKSVILSSRISGYASALEKSHQQKSEEIHSQPMGTLVKKFFEHIYPNDSESTTSDNEITEPYLSFSLSFSTDEAYIESKRRTLRSLVDERNHLVHHLLLKLDLLSIESCNEMGEFLDEQRERQKEEHEHLRELLKNICDAWNEFSAFHASDEGQKAIELSWLQQSPVVSVLFELSTSLARPDGWALLHSAAQQIQSILPNEVAKLKKQYGYKTLNEILVASELFELESEPTNKGGVRLLYRVKPELANVYH